MGDDVWHSPACPKTPPAGHWQKGWQGLPARTSSTLLLHPQIHPPHQWGAVSEDVNQLFNSLRFITEKHRYTNNQPNAGFLTFCPKYSNYCGYFLFFCMLYFLFIFLIISLTNRKKPFKRNKFTAHSCSEFGPSAVPRASPAPWDYQNRKKLSTQK